MEIWKNRLQRFKAGIRKAIPFSTGVLAVLMAMLIYRVIFPPPQPMTVQDIDNTVAQVLASATPPPSFSSRVYQIIQPSLVLIQTKSSSGLKGADFGLGSGVVIDKDGNILTSLHVIDNADEINITFADGTQSTATVVSEQPENDIAVLQAETLPGVVVPAVLGNPFAMRVGDEAYAVGNPFGLYSSMSAGVISGFDRTFEIPSHNVKLKGLIQIDAAVNPGNSGGPLLNRDGYVVGIVTGIVNPTEQSFFVGIGFAVPINVAISGMGSPPY
jgi:S1-C subfamily serine protease